MTTLRRDDVRLAFRADEAEAGEVETREANRDVALAVRREDDGERAVAHPFEAELRALTLRRAEAEQETALERS